MTNDSVVDIERITKRFSGHVAVEELSLSVPRGAVYGLLGPNGAGKTTTIRMAMDILIPDEGTVRLFGDLRGGRAPEAAGIRRAGNRQWCRRRLPRASGRGGGVTPS